MEKVVYANIYEDEWYPVLSLYPNRDGFENENSIEVSNELVEEWDQLMIQFKDMQSKLNKILKQDGEYYEK